MSSYRSVLTCAAVVFVAALHAPRAARAQETPRWFRDFDAALAESARSQRPLLIAFNADLGGESANHEAAFGVYRDDKLVRALADAVAVVASADDHRSGDGFCSRFGHVACDDHRAIEKRARRHLFGEQESTIAPQHVVLLPDGTVAWHRLYAVSAGELVRALDDATRQWKRSSRSRAGAHADRFRKLLAGAAGDPERYLVASSTFVHAPSDAFAPMLRAIPDRELGRRLIDDLARIAPGRAIDRVDAIGRDCPKHLREAIEEVRARLHAERVAAYVREPASEATGERASERPAPIATRGPLPDLGAAQEIPGARFGDPAPSLLGARDVDTVLLFFLPNDPNLASQVALWNRFAERNRGRALRVVALGASVAPGHELERAQGAGFAFPAGTYLYESTAAPYGITSFPAAVVLDREGRVRFLGDAYGAFERAVARLPAAEVAAPAASR